MHIKKCAKRTWWNWDHVKNRKKVIGYDLHNKPFNKYITTFSVNGVFQHVELECIVDYNDTIRFDVQDLFPSWVCDGKWNNRAICLQLHGYSFGNYSTQEERTDIIFCVILMHMLSITLQKNLTFKEEVVVGLCQVLHQHSPLHNLLIHITLLKNVCNNSSQTIILEHHCTETKCDSCSRIFLSLFQ